MRVDVMEINEGNKLIAEFMAIKTELPHYLLINQKSEIKSGWYQVDRMLYHSSWDWLMPVVEKIESYFDGNVQVDIKGNRWTVISLGSQYAITREDIELNIEKKGKSKIQSTWLAIVEFIEWLNSNLTRTGQKLKDDE